MVIRVEFKLTEKEAKANAEGKFPLSWVETCPFCFSTNIRKLPDDLVLCRSKGCRKVGELREVQVRTPGTDYVFIG